MARPVNPDALLARRLREARKRIGVSQRELGLLMGLAASVAAPRINQYERGSAEPSVEDLQRLAEALGVPAAALVTEDPALHRLLMAWADASSAARAEAIRQLEARVDRGNRPGLRATQKRVAESLSALAIKRRRVEESETQSAAVKKRARKNST